MANGQRSGSDPQARSPAGLADLRRQRRAAQTDAYLREQDAHLAAREVFRRIQLAHGEGRHEAAEAVEFQARTGDFRALTRAVQELARTHRGPSRGAGTGR